MNLRWRLSGQQPLSQARKVWRYANADLPKACELFEHTEWDSVITGDINEALSNWERKFLQVMEECIPVGTIPSKPNLPWLTRDVLRISRKRNLLYRRAKRTRHSNKYKLARNMSVKMLRTQC